MHNVHHKNGDIAQRRASGAKVAERFVTRRVDDQQTGDLERLLRELMDHFGCLADGLDGYVGGAVLLRDAARLAVLDVGAAELVQNFRLARVDVAQHAHDMGAQNIQASLLFSLVASFLQKRRRPCKKNRVTNTFILLDIPRLACCTNF